ncbi:hypothetical protein [Oceanirhabdus sp. W0125-5]|uniref:hypothetical protein n=1 Tax=Oceanirhabdus sp. W0125-5 TaxID=2999116 RepID=UPI0022F32570|nr:hypothetical protein [Oceanirhabdus sp. W0125-5]WBW95952.1 hypothetical protein OW730_20000 [Oceanirhabdus sp. W0125-5]
MLDYYGKGKKKIKIILGILLGIDGFTVLMMLLAMELPSMLKGIIRALLTFWLFTKILEGKNWARITISVLSILGGIMGMLLSLITGIITLLIGILFLSLGIILLSSKDIRGYMNYKKEENKLMKEIPQI